MDINTLNRIADTGFGYDAAGNLTNTPNPGGLAMQYDAENRMIATAGVTYAYDGDGRRVKKSNGKLYWYGGGGLDALLETDLAGNTPTEYVFFGGMRTARRDNNGAVFYYFSNHLGSTSVMTNGTGTAVEESDYYPFGGERAVVNNDPNAYKFSGKERDTESGLDNYGARYYGSGFGRFISSDEPFVDQFTDDPQSWNLYTYVRNNPLNLVDPTGQSCIKTDDGQSADDGDGKGCEEAGVKPDEEGKQGAIEPQVEIVSGLDGLTQEDRIFELSARVYGNVTDLSAGREGIKAANSVIDALSDCVQGNCGPWQALALIPFGKGLKHLRVISTGRLKGFLRGVSELAGGEAAAKSTFQQLTGKVPNGAFDRVVQGTKEIVFRSATRSSSGSAAVEIIDHSSRTLEVIHFK